MFGAALITVLLAALIAIPVVVSFGARTEGEVSAQSVQSATPVSTVTTPDPAQRSAAEEAVEITALMPDPVEFAQGGEGPQASFYRISDGYQMGTANERKARPALSLIKLYIADYVLEHGTLAERYDALHMLVDSSDRLAAELYRSYPESVNEVAEEYDLYTTQGASHWGHSVTSTYDAVSYVSQLMAEDPTHPILTAMSLSAEIAADGYDQDFGTAQLPGALGTKWGWSDGRELHSSVSFGEGWVAAASVTGSADDLTEFAAAQLGQAAREAEASSTAG